VDNVRKVQEESQAKAKEQIQKVRAEMQQQIN